MIQAIVYDAVGTLLHVQPNVASIYADIGQRFGSLLGIDEIRRRFGTAFARQDQLDQQAGWRTSEPREKERWRQIVAEVLDDVTDAACFGALFETFAKPDVWKCDPDAATVLAHFHGQGIRQALASNFDRRLRGVIAPMPIARYLEALVISSEIGWRKPAPEFFVHVAESLRLPPNAILFVGDDCINDYDAACRAGMQALLLDPGKRHDGGVNRIERLSEVMMACV
jgi:putative hydrolase of the HAD superfamily